MSRLQGVSCEPTEFFGFSVSRAIALKVFGSGRLSIGTRGVVIATSTRWRADADTEPSGRLSYAAYPGSITALFELLVDVRDDRCGRDRLDVLVPKSAFVELADQAGADHLVELTLGAGVAANDPVMTALQQCYTGLRELSSQDADSLADRLVDATITHLAERYGGMRKPLGVASGGLAPWQLRLARRSLNDLHATAPLTNIASECGLSTGHFARAFKRSTGKSPHQWAVLRRIEAAKEMMRVGIPLAEIAVACRFSDQSHLTRAFSQATGLTPGRWRNDRAMVEHAVRA